MRQRCTNPNTPGWANYGGRGITVCDRWRRFEAFLEDMGERPSPRHSLDRIDNDGNYEPSNCRWATPQQQLGNRRGCVTVEVNGEVMNLSAAARLHNIPPEVVRSRRRNGWPESRWFEPVQSPYWRILNASG